MKIAIDVNGVLRDTLGKMEQVYQKFFIDDYIMEEGEEKFEYKMNLPVTSDNFMEHFEFPSNEKFYDFLYVDFPMNIFGHAPSVSPNTFTVLNDIYQDLRNHQELWVISEEIQKSKPATLFFLSKYGCLVENYLFYSEITFDRVWENFDIVLTSNPKLLKTKPQGKKTIKVATDYNSDFDSDFTINSLDEFTKLYEELNLII
jgi:hypothetical protein